MRTIKGEMKRGSYEEGRSVGGQDAYIPRTPDDEMERWRHTPGTPPAKQPRWWREKRGIEVSSEDEGGANPEEGDEMLERQGHSGRGESEQCEGRDHEDEAEEVEGLRKVPNVVGPSRKEREEHEIRLFPLPRLVHILYSRQGGH